MERLPRPLGVNDAVQRRCAIEAGRIHVSMIFDEVFRNVEVPVDRGEQQRRTSIRAAKIEFGSGLYESAYGCGIAVARSVHQGCQAAARVSAAAGIRILLRLL